MYNRVRVKLLLLSTCLHFDTGLKLVKRDFFGKEDLFAPLFGDIETIIMCSFDFDLKKRNKTKQNKKSARLHLHVLKKSCGGQPNNYFFFGLVKVI